MCSDSHSSVDPHVPTAAIIRKTVHETADTLTFHVATPEGEKPFAHLPGQCAMLGLPGVGEAMFSISSSSTCDEMEFSIKKVGLLTGHLHQLEVGSKILIRGAYGTPFPVKDAFKGKNLTFAAGGIGIAPLRSVIRFVLANRKDYGTINIIYGARTSADLVYFNEINSVWRAAPNFNVHLTIDRAESGWNERVGFVPSVVSDIFSASNISGASGLNTQSIAVVCGPPIMITHTLAALQAAGFEKSNIYTTLEMRMKCGIGKCGRCNIGHKYVCLDGPVFRCDELEALPQEY
jgi:NAD(P)H-flavin reductase